MASLKVFVSSTCYDLGVVRSQLRNFLISFGFDPIMSDFSDVLFDPRTHTHTSCVQEVVGCDMLIIIVGSRFGGTAVPQAINEIDIEKLREVSSSNSVCGDLTKLSISQLEVLKAIQVNVPIFTFVDVGVLNDHLTYEKNKAKQIITDLEFPHIDKQETAKFIFEFINFLRHRKENNSVTPFSKFEDIENHLRKQWAGLFQRLLYEHRMKENEAGKIDYLSNQLADIKAAIMTSISSSELKETAKGAIKFRILIDFIYGISRRPVLRDIEQILFWNIGWQEVLSNLNIKEIRSDKNEVGTVLICKDGTYYRTRYSAEKIGSLKILWDDFRTLNAEIKKAIVTALIDNIDVRPFFLIKYYNENYLSVDEAEQVTADDIPF